MPRKRWMRQPLSWHRGGAVALVILVLVAGAALILDTRADDAYGAVIQRFHERGREPLELLTEMGRSAPILVLSDVHGRAAPKRLAAELVRQLAEEPGLDAVVLEVPASEQRFIDAYIGGGDASALLSRPRAVQESQGLAREYLEIYRAVRTANDALPPARRVRVIAADVEGWPPDGSAPRAIGELYAGRAEHMLARLDERLFSVMPDARVLVFVDGYMALQGVYGELEFGGGDPVRVEWLGELLRRRSGAEARTVLLDLGSQGEVVRRVPAFHGTELHRPLRRALDGAVGVRVRGDLATVTDPVLGLTTPGLTLRILPVAYTLGEAAQGYIFLPGGR